MKDQPHFTSSVPLLLCTALLCAFLGHQAWAAEAETILLPPGVYHQDEVKTTSGPGWLALFPGSDEDGPRLEPATLIIEPAHDALVDEEGEATGKRVTVAGDGPDPVFLIAGEHGLRPGPVIAATPSEGTLPRPEPLLRITLVGKVYELSHELAHPFGPDDPRGEPLPGSLVLRSGDVSQSLADFFLWYNPDTETVTFIGDDAFTRLLWAGDLDGDGRLDLYIDLTDHYNVSEPTLLLSSAASPGELVAPVASHVSTGC